MKVGQKDSFRKLQLSDKSGLKAADTLVTKVSAAQLQIQIEIMYKFAITCLLLVYLFTKKLKEKYCQGHNRSKG